MQSSLGFKLYKATRDGSIKKVRILLSKKEKIDVNWQKEGLNCGASALHAACKYGHHDIAALLLDYGADMELTRIDSRESTPLMEACTYE